MSTSGWLLLITRSAEDLTRQVTHVLRVANCQVVAAGPRTRVVPTSARTPSNQRFTPLAHDSRLKAQDSLPHTLVEMRNVTVRYGSCAILHNVTWTIHAGQSWALLGPNG